MADRRERRRSRIFEISVLSSPRATGSGRTRLSPTSTADGLLQRGHRLPMKEQRKMISPEFMLSEKDIKKFYCNNSLTSKRHNGLETIYEDTSVAKDHSLIGYKKLKRTMDFKRQVKISNEPTRRRNVKRKRFQRIPMYAFLEHLQSFGQEEEKVARR